MSRLILVEEDNNIRLSLAKALRQHGHYITALPDTDQLAAQLAIVRPDLLILALPSDFISDYLKICEEIRTWSEVPILLTATLVNRPAPARIIKAGVDELMLKPFTVEELISAMESVFEHRVAGSATTPMTVHAGNLSIDLKTRQVSAHGSAIRLTPKEYDLLSVLATAEGSAVSHESLTTSLWGQTDFKTRTHLHALVRRLRKKLQDNALNDDSIVCEPRFGYRLLITAITSSISA